MISKVGKMMSWKVKYTMTFTFQLVFWKIEISSVQNAKIAILFAKIRVSRVLSRDKFSRENSQRRQRNRGFSICLQNSSFLAERYGVDMECLAFYNQQFTQWLLCCIVLGVYSMKIKKIGQKTKIVAAIANYWYESHVSDLSKNTIDR